MNSTEYLEELGYNLVPNGSAYRTSALYRGGNSPTSLCIYPEEERWYDFVKKVGGNISELIAATIKKQNPQIKDQELKESLDKLILKEPSFKKQFKLNKEKSYPEDSLLKLKKDYSYWNKRGISDKTMKLFEGGVASNGPMRYRYVFPIRDEKRIIRGFSGRWVLSKRNDNVPKWKHFPKQDKWRFPIHINEKIIEEQKKIILIESIGDCLSLWEAGVKNTIVCFTTSLNKYLRNYIVSLDPDKIIVSFNNDFNKPSNPGKNRAIKVAKDLTLFFDREQIKIILPKKNDFGEMTKEEIKEWQEKI